MLPTIMGHLFGLKSLWLDLETKWQAISIRQINASLHFFGMRKCTVKMMALLDTFGAFQNLDQPFEIVSRRCTFITKLLETVFPLINLEYLEINDCKKLQGLPNSIGQPKLLVRLNSKKYSSL
jgi:hypothetical protein